MLLIGLAIDYAVRYIAGPVIDGTVTIIANNLGLFALIGGLSVLLELAGVPLLSWVIDSISWGILAIAEFAWSLVMQYVDAALAFLREVIADELLS